MKLKVKSINSFLYKYPILLPLLGFSTGIVINEYIPGDIVWVTVLILSVLFGLASIFFVNFRFLLLVPIGLLFAWGPLTTQLDDIDRYIGEKIDVEGTLYRSPEQRNEGTRLFIDTEGVIRGGALSPTNGKVIVTSGDALEGLRYGDRVRVLDVELKEFRNFHNPGGFDIKGFYQRQGIRARGFTQGKDYVISFGRASSANPLLYYLDGIRIGFASFVTRNFKYPESSLLNAITVGFRGGVSGELREEFSRAGVAHVLAISGLHVGAVAVFFYFLFKFAFSRSEYFLLRFQMPRIAAGLTILPVFIYTALAGFSTSAVRAFIMATLYLASIAIGRDENKLNTLGAAALIILIWHPWSLFELSFRLSFSAVLAILLVHNVYPFKFKTLKDKFYSLIKSSMAAGFVTLPLVVNSFGILPLLSIPANVVLVPFVEFLIIPLALVSLVSFLISPSISAPIVGLNVLLMEFVVSSIKMLNWLPYSYILMPRLSPVSWTFFIAIGASLLLMRGYRKLTYALPVLALCFILSVFLVFSDGGHRENIRVNILDAGENRSAVFITLPDGKNILIDGGHRRFTSGGYLEKAVIAKYLLNAGVNKIDYLILSSTDKDHLEGTEYLLENFSVENLFTNGDRLKGGVWEIIYARDIIWRDLLELKNIDLSDGYKIEILKPGDNYVIKDSFYSYPVALILAGRGFSLMTGEGLQTEDVQKSLLSNQASSLKSLVLYMPDISMDSYFIKFLKAVSPEALITNRLKDSVLRAIDGPINIYQTSLQGMVTIYHNNNKLKITTFIAD